MLRVSTFVLLAIVLIYTIQEASAARDRCAPLRCEKHCQYGEQEVNGCKVCKCNDPCNPPGGVSVCAPHQKCRVTEKRPGNFVATCSGKDFRGTKSPCQQKLAVGTCRSNLKRFYYNPSMRRCEEFYYKGCGGNDNNFATIKECRRACVI